MSDKLMSGAQANPMIVTAPGPETLRLDRYLWFARFLKSRTGASALCAAGRIRINRAPVHKASSSVRVGDVLTFPQGKRIRVIRVLSLGSRRGPPAEARALYEDLDPVAPAQPKSR